MVEREDLEGVTVLTMAHGKANAFDVELAQELDAELGQMADADEPRAIVLTGRGSIFSAGVDLLRVTAGGADYVREFLPALSAVLRTLFLYPKPVVAAVNGHAIAGGCLLASACDHRIGARGKGRLGVPELLVGVPFPALALEILRFAVAGHRVQELVYSGRTVGVDDAVAYGLLDELVEPDELRDRACRKAASLAAIGAAAFRLTKAQLRAPVRCFLDQHGTALDAAADAAWTSPAALASIQAYVAQVLGAGKA